MLVIAGTCDYGVIVFLKNMVRRPAQDSGERADDVGAVGIGRLHSRALVVWDSCKMRGQLHGRGGRNPFQNDDGSDGDQRVAGKLFSFGILTCYWGKRGITARGRREERIHGWTHMPRASYGTHCLSDGGTGILVGAGTAVIWANQHMQGRLGGAGQNFGERTRCSRLRRF